MSHNVKKRTLGHLHPLEIHISMRIRALWVGRKGVEII